MPEILCDVDPLEMILPEPQDRASWTLLHMVTAADTRESVLIYRHTVTGRALRLDRACRVYGEDAQGVIRLFGRGGMMALAVALNAVYDGADDLRPTRVLLPGAAVLDAG